MRTAGIDELATRLRAALLGRPLGMRWLLVRRWHDAVRRAGWDAADVQAAADRASRKGGPGD